MDLPKDVPSHDTFRRVSHLLQPDAFQRCFMNCVRSLVQLRFGEAITLDGNTVRCSYGNWNGK